MHYPQSVDVFCRVIDNYGDIGVCWRLARQMAVDDGKLVRLFVDDLVSMAQIIPAPDPRVEVILWNDALVYDNSADLVIEAFACDLPDQVVAVMQKRENPPVWVDLEYLTAEKWAQECHGVPSVHPSTGLRKYMMFPGFSDQTGGVIYENNLIAKRDFFQNSLNAQNMWRKQHQLPEIDSNFIDLSLFCYKNIDVDRFFNDLSALKRPVRVFMPVFDGFFIEKRGNVTIYHVNFLPQDQYDFLLWSCDINFVRGEDSFVRAQLAARPLIWQIYQQEDNAHLIKLTAFLDVYCAAFSPGVREGLAKSMNLWNVEGAIGGEVWDELFNSLPLLTDGAKFWADGLASRPSLAQSLYDLCENNNILIKKDL